MEALNAWALEYLNRALEKGGIRVHSAALSVAAGIFLARSKKSFDAWSHPVLYLAWLGVLTGMIVLMYHAGFGASSRRGSR